MAERGRRGLRPRRSPSGWSPARASGRCAPPCTPSPRPSPRTASPPTPRTGRDHRRRGRALPLRRRRHPPPGDLRRRPGHGPGAPVRAVRRRGRAGPSRSCSRRGPAATTPAPPRPDRPGRWPATTSTTRRRPRRAPRWLEALIGELGGRPPAADPGRVHPEGRAGARLVEDAREQVAALARRPAPAGGVHLGRDRGDQRGRLGSHPGPPRRPGRCSPRWSTPPCATPRRGSPR